MSASATQGGHKNDSRAYCLIVVIQ